jgi:uncharacterized protein
LRSSDNIAFEPLVMGEIHLAHATGPSRSTMQYGPGIRPTIDPGRVILQHEGMTLRTRWSILVLVLTSLAMGDDAAHRAEVEKWRQEREAALKADDGFLTVAGLYFLQEGSTRFGADPSNDIVLPSGPAEAGVFEHRSGVTTVKLTAGTPATINGKPVQEMTLKPDTAEGGPDRIVMGSLTLFVHASGRRQAIRARDTNSRLRREFTGCKWFPIDSAYRVEGRLMPYNAQKRVELPNILGDIEEFRSPGLVAFTLQGREIKMEPVLSSRGRYWFIFRDQTSGKETYSAARFVYADAPGADMKVVIDFNRAYNPPCAFNPHTTCPLPSPQNRLPIPIRAGELDYKSPSG